jgi:16S rRNA (guanine527-N7)-methyltransferase
MTSEHDTQFKSVLEAALTSLDQVSLSEKQITQLVKHYSLMRAWNRRVNLTRIVEPDEAARLHYADSLFGGRFIEHARRILDIGSGAGFPALPLAVLRPDVEVTALEANQKKSVFLKEARDELGLTNFKVATARLESFDLAGYDLLTSRALDRAEEILPPVIARLIAHQRFMLYCAPDLLAKINNLPDSMIEVKTHRVPQAESRLIAIFSRAG